MEENQLDVEMADIKKVNYLYLFSMLLLVSVGYIAQNWSFNWGIIITEYGLIALPAIAFVIYRKKKIKELFKFNRLDIVSGILVTAIFLLGYFIAAFLNIVGNTVLSTFGKLVIPEIPIADDFVGYLTLLFIIAVSAGICEELLFRGVLLSEYTALGKWPGIIITSALFSMMHLNIQNIFATFFLGVLLGYVVYSTNSIFAGMLGHSINNGISVTLAYVLMKLPMYQKMSPEMIEAAGMDTKSLIAACIFLGFLSLISGSLMIMCISALKERTALIVKPNATVVDAKLVMKNIKTSWPIYVGTIIFLGYMLLELYYIRMGTSLLKRILQN